jgi:hypothetical protein
MAIDTINKLETGLDSRFIRITGNKTSIANLTAGQYGSTWRSTGNPAQGAIPTTAATVNNNTLGARGQVNPTGTDNLYFGSLEVSCVNAGTTVEFHDRLVANGGLSGTVTTAQNGFDLNTFLATDNIAERIGDSNYSDVQWWLEIYTDIGTTGVTVSNLLVTYNDGTTGNLSSFTLGNTLRRAGTMFPLNSLIPATAAGKFIRGIVSITHASTQTAGSYGFTATRYRCGAYAPRENQNYKYGWTEIGLPQIYDSSALFTIVLTPTTATGVINYYSKIIYG